MCKWMPSGKNRIDPCLREAIDLANIDGHKTLASCCGHGKYEDTIVIKLDGVVREYNTGIKMRRKKRFYARDCEGIFYIPEVEMWRYIGFCAINGVGDKKQNLAWINSVGKHC